MQVRLDVCSPGNWFASEVGDKTNFVLVSCAVAPGFDFADLQRRVRYPDMARRNGIEGQVLVAALVGRDGSVEKTQVISSDNEILNSAALAAVRETVFTPAIQNQSPVRVWVRIPISFKLR